MRVGSHVRAAGRHGAAHRLAVLQAGNREAVDRLGCVALVGKGAGEHLSVILFVCIERDVQGARGDGERHVEDRGVVGIAAHLVPSVRVGDGETGGDHIAVLHRGEAVAGVVVVGAHRGEFRLEAAAVEVVAGGQLLVGNGHVRVVEGHLKRCAVIYLGGILVLHGDMDGALADDQVAGVGGHGELRRHVAELTVKHLRCAGDGVLVGAGIGGRDGRRDAGYGVGVVVHLEFQRVESAHRVRFAVVGEGLLVGFGDDGDGVRRGAVGDGQLAGGHVVGS